MLHIAGLWVFYLTACGVSAQQANLPTITFQFEFPGSVPDHYFISISADGHASYDSTGHFAAESADGNPYRIDFTVSDATRARVFDLAKQADYFQGKIDSGNKKLASTGAKTLTYSGAGRSTQARYNYSPQQPIQQLTQLFADMSNTLEFGRRLEYEYRYEKLALDDELKKMEEIAKENELAEIALVAPVLRKIANDSSLVNVARARAQRLLAATDR